MVNIAYAVSGSRMAAEDLAQEAMLVAYRRWDEVASLERPGAWVRRVVLNRAASLFRRRGYNIESLNVGQTHVPGVSRMTVNRALRELSHEGRLYRVQGVGTFVAAQKPQAAFLTAANFACRAAA